MATIPDLCVAPKGITTLSPAGMDPKFRSSLDLLPVGGDLEKLYTVVRDEGTGADYIISLKDLQDTLLSDVPPTDSYRLAFNMAVETSFRMPATAFVEKLCRAWSLSFGDLSYVGSTKSSIYVSGVCHDQELFMKMYKILCYDNSKGVRFVDMEG